MSREDRLALLDSEVFQELERAEKLKQAQSLSDKIVNSPTAQKAISDGITRALENTADDAEEEHEKIKADIAKLDDHVLLEFYKMFAKEVHGRDLDTEDAEEEYEETEDEETDEDEKKEEEEMENVFAFVKSSLTKLAYSAADSGDTEAAYLIERFVQKIS